MAVDSTHPSYNAMVENWDTIRDLCSCEKEIHRMGDKYIPKLSGQTTDEFESYVKRASMVFFTKRTMEAFHGMIMRKDVHVDGYSSVNMDGRGSSVNSYVSKIVKEFIKYGRCGTLEDMPLTNDVLSVADEIEKNVLPRLLYYSCFDIINWKKKVINNVEVLSMVVLREVEDTSTDEFDHDPKYVYRVLDLVEENGTHVYRQRLYDNSLTQRGSDIFPLRGGEKLKFIPFQIHGGVDVSYPPLLLIAELNIHHYQLDADLKHGLHFVALPTPWVAGVDDKDKPKSIGPTVIWAFEDPQTRCGMLEFTGQGLSQISKEKNEIVETIITLASKVIAPEKSSNDESALAAAVRSNAETSSLAGYVDQLSEDIENAIRVMVWWIKGDPSKVSVKINKDFMPSSMSGTDVLAYITGWIKGGISYPSLFQILKRGEVVKGDRNIDDELKDITEEQKNRAAEDLKKQESDPATKIDNKLI